MRSDLVTVVGTMLAVARREDGANGQNRTADLLITNHGGAPTRNTGWAGPVVIAGSNYPALRSATDSQFRKPRTGEASLLSSVHTFIELSSRSGRLPQIRHLFLIQYLLQCKD